MIINADILAWAASYDGPLFHALLCDPPYHLTEITKRFGGTDAAPAQYGTDGAFQRASKGFMGRTWDGGMVAFQPETWAAIARLLHPGAFLMAFAGSRGYHRMACAIEDAGFIIHPAIGWAFGSGFPKATRLDTAIDRRAGAERTTVSTRRHQPKFAAKDFGYREKDNGYNSRERESFDVTAPATELAQAWQGHRYGLQALKPAFEFICVAQKPYQGRPVESITMTGAGALNIDGSRIGTDEDTARRRVEVNGVAPFGHGSLMGGDGHPAGRWPSNLLLVHDARCNSACHPDCPVVALGAQSGESSSPPVGSMGGGSNSKAIYGDFAGERHTNGHGDQGTAARFFFNADWMLDRLEQADAIRYVPKADRSEREAGLDPRQIALMGMEEVGERNNDQKISASGHGKTISRCAKHGMSLSAGSVYGCGCPVEYIPRGTINDGREKSIDNPYQRGETTRRNIHPTLKPLSLCRYLATLLLPPAEYAPRRLLIPFAGAGSEYIGAMLAGWEEIVGVELEQDHCRIAEARITYWRQRRHEFLDPSKPIDAQLSDAPDGQLDMFGG